MNVFITGATGFIGTHLVRALQADERVGRIYCMDLSGTRERADFGVRWKRCSLEDVQDLRFDEPIDVVVHLAGTWRKEDPRLLSAVNCEGTRHVLEMCEANAVPRIVFVSTINVKLRHPGAYASTKAAAERLVAESGLAYAIVRPTLVYGDGDGGMSRIVSFIDRGLPVPVFGRGQALEQPIPVDELVAHLCAAIFSDERAELVEAGGADRMPYDEMLDAVAVSRGRRSAKKLHLPVAPFLAGAKLLEALGLPSPLTSEQIRHMDEDLVADAEKPAAYRGLPSRSFAEGMRDYGRAPGRDAGTA